MNPDIKMLTLNTILEELNDVPVDRLEDVYSFIHSLKANPKKSQASKKKILSYAGLFNGMSQKDYDDFLKEVKKTRTDLFDRDINL